MTQLLPRLLYAGLLAAPLVAAAAQQPQAPSIDALVRMARESLQKADADRLGELWDAGAAVLKTRVPKASFLDTVHKSRKAMGPVKDREWAHVSRVQYMPNNAPGLPAGLYANVDFETRLANGKTASEKVSFMQESGGWRFTGYIPTAAPEAPEAPVVQAPSALPAPTVVAAATPATAPPAAPAPSAASANPAQPPAPSAASAPSAPGASVAEVETAVRAWASVWSARDVTGYLAAYAPDFTPAHAQNRKRWEEDRRARITGKSSISVGIEDLVVSVNGQTASARFRQVYRADKLNEMSLKTLELQRVGNRWLIRKESAGN